MSLVDINMRRTYTHNNHLQYGYGPDLAEFSPDLDFQIVYGEISRTLSTPFLEAGHAAKLIDESTDRPIYLCLSGGIDSECMAEAFLQANVGFTPISLIFKNGFNEFDLKNAVQFCKKHDLELKTLELDLYEFCNSSLYRDYVKEYRCGYPMSPVHLWLLDQIEGFPVMSGNPPSLEDNRENGIGVGLPNDHLMVYHRFFGGSGKDGVGHFFLYSPELIESFLHLPIYQNYLNGVLPLSTMKSDLYAFKCRTYKSSGFKALRRVDKYTGFEHFERWYYQKFGRRWLSEYIEVIKEILPELTIEEPPDYLPFDKRKYEDSFEP